MDAPTRAGLAWLYEIAVTRHTPEAEAAAAWLREKLAAPPEGPPCTASPARA